MNTIDTVVDKDRNGNHILLVDHGPKYRRIIAERLERWGHTVTTASDGQSALEQLAKHPPDVLVVNPDVPDMPGLQLLERLQLKAPQSPIVVLSPTSDMQTVLEAVRQGAFDYIVKGDDPERLRLAVVRAGQHVALLNERKDLMDKLRHQKKQSGETERHLSQERIELQETIIALKRTQGLVNQAEKMAGVGLLTAGLGHEINNPLMFVMTNMDLFRDWAARALQCTGVDKLYLSGEIQALIDETEIGLRRIQGVTKALGSFSRHSEFRIESINVHDALSAVLQLLGREAAPVLVLKTPPSNIGLLQGNSARLTHVLFDLMVKPLSPKNLGTLRRVHVSVEQDIRGATIHIEQSLNTTTDENEGQRVAPATFGLDIRACARLIEQMGGELTTESPTPVTGKIHIHLPYWENVVEAPAHHSEEEASEEIKGTSRPNVLMLDHPPHFPAELRIALGDAFDVTEFQSGTDALRWLATHSSVDVILCGPEATDMTGVDFYRVVTEWYPALRERFLFLSSPDGALERDAHIALPAQTLKTNTQPGQLVDAIKRVACA